MTFWSHSPVLLALGVTWRLWLPLWTGVETTALPPVQVHGLKLPVSKPALVSDPPPPPPPPVVVTVRVYVALWLPVAAVPVTVIGYVPAATDEPTVAVSVELPPDVTELGLSETLTPEGAPDAARLTDSEIGRAHV